VREEGLAELSYAHAVSTDLYLGQVFVVDEVRIHGSIPLDADDRFWLGSTLGYQAGRVLDEVGNPAADVDVIVGDVALAWQFEDELRFSVRYQHIEQMTDADALPPLPLSFVRNSVMFGATLELPREQDMPRRYRRSERVDESDEVRDELEENPASTAPGL
jgi:hypothetical protein